MISKGTSLNRVYRADTEPGQFSDRLHREHSAISGKKEKKSSCREKILLETESISSQLFNVGTTLSGANSSVSPGLSSQSCEGRLVIGILFGVEGSLPASGKLNKW